MAEQELEVVYLDNYNPDWPRVRYAHDDDAGFDLVAAIRCHLFVYPSERVVVPCGINLGIPAGFEIQVRPRSGMALKHGITVLNSPGTVDSGYRGEIAVILINHGDQAFLINPGDRIAQAVFSEFTRAKFKVVTSLSPSERGENGFGSTG